MTGRSPRDVPAGALPDFSEALLEIMSEGVVAVDADRRISYVNRAAEGMTGASGAEAVGRPCCEVFGASLCAGDCALGRALRTGRRVLERQVAIRGADGPGTHLRLSTVPRKEPDGSVGGAVGLLRDLSAVEEMRRELRGERQLGDIVARSEPMRQVLAVLPRIAESDATVLLEGEGGTGKELVARSIHNASARAGGPFVAVGCTALPDALLESELFGHDAGAPAEAKRGKKGLLETSCGGTIFLDEIADLSPALQVRLLRVLQEGVFQPLGSSRSVEAEVRLIAATKRNLDELVTGGQFRQDLFYRLSVVRIQLPPLRERLDDIAPLIRKTVGRLNAKEAKAIGGLDGASMAAFLRHDWPGNVRELENALEHAFVLCPGGSIRLEHLPVGFRPAGGLVQSPCGATLAELEAWAIRQALVNNGGRKGDAARELGINPSTLWRKMKKMGLK